MRKSLKVFVVFTVLATVLAIPGVALAHHPGITADPDCVNSDGTWDFDYTVTGATDFGYPPSRLQNPSVDVWFIWNGATPTSNNPPNFIAIGAVFDQNAALVWDGTRAFPSFDGDGTAPDGTGSLIIWAVPRAPWSDGTSASGSARWVEVWEPNACFDNPGTGTPGYWHKIGHWADEGIRGVTIGGVDYSAAEAIAIINMPVKGDKTLTMFPALVAAKLNVMIGNDDSCISATIGLADRWMRAYPPESGVKANTRAWKIGEPFYKMLDQYNNGYLCAPHRD